MDNLSSFYRPTTIINRLAALVEPHIPSKRVTQDHINRWREDTALVLSNMDGFKNAVASKVVNETDWNLIEGNPPQNSWYGIVEVDPTRKKQPRVVMYEQSLVARMPTEYLFELTGQSGMDHLYGHLYPHHAKHKDCGEEVACRIQQGIARLRAEIYKKHSPTQWLLPLNYWLHKRIPFANYKGDISLSAKQ